MTTQERQCSTCYGRKYSKEPGKYGIPCPECHKAPKQEVCGITFNFGDGKRSCYVTCKNLKLCTAHEAKPLEQKESWANELRGVFNLKGTDPEGTIEAIATFITYLIAAERLEAQDTWEQFFSGLVRDIQKILDQRINSESILLNVQQFIDLQKKHLTRLNEPTE